MLIISVNNWEVNEPPRKPVGRVRYWNKSSADARLRFYDDKNNEIKWNAGKTWIEIVSSQEDLSILFEEEDSTSE